MAPASDPARVTRQQEMFSRALTYMAEAIPALVAAQSSSGSSPSFFAGPASPGPLPVSSRPLLYGPSGSALQPDPSYNYYRSSAKRTGSMKNWIPKRLVDRTVEAYEREAIVDRSCDLVNNDPQAAGIVDTYATTVVGPGLLPVPSLSPAVLGLDKQDVRRIQAEQKAVYTAWYPIADAGRRMTAGAIQYLVQRNLVQYGEYLALIHMIDDPLRAYSLAVHVVNPLRLKTPTDLARDPRIRDGVELGDYGEPVAYWIKKSAQLMGQTLLTDHSSNFLRVPAWVGNRPCVLHGFVCQDAEQVRGVPWFSPAMKMFRDFGDLLDAELVSNIVTAAFAVAIECMQGTNPYEEALRNSFGEQGIRRDGSTEVRRYSEFTPGQLLYLNAGEKVSPIKGDRPGITFDPFTVVIKKAIAMSLNQPYATLFKDPGGVSFAGWRGAMLEAWRVFSARRVWLADGFCQPLWMMLQEEAYLRGTLNVPDFYGRVIALTAANWLGAPKGDIEPVKQIQADVLAIRNNIKTRRDSIAERGGELTATFDDLQEEQEMMDERGLTESAIEPTPSGPGKPAKGLADDVSAPAPDDSGSPDDTGDGSEPLQGGA